jgi:hypothetical protein
MRRFFPARFASYSASSAICYLPDDDDFVHKTDRGADNTRVRTCTKQANCAAAHQLAGKYAEAPIDPRLCTAKQVIGWRLQTTDDVRPAAEVVYRCPCSKRCGERTGLPISCMLRLVNEARYSI